MSSWEQMQAGLQARVTRVSFDPRGMAPRSFGGEGQSEPARVALLPREGEIPWPARLAHAAGSEAGAGSESPPFQTITRTQRRRMQRRWKAAMFGEAAPQQPQSSSEAEANPGDPEKPAPSAHVASGPSWSIVCRLSL